MGFFSSIAPIAGAAIGFWAGGPAGAAAGYSIGSSLSASENQKDAAEQMNAAQQAGGNRAANLAQFYQNQANQNITPWMLAGNRGLEGLEQVATHYQDVLQNPSKYIESPDYNWMMDQGTNALARGASASGKLGSGQYSKDLMKFGQGLASTQKSNYLNQVLAGGNLYGQMSNQGLTAATSIGALGQDTARNVGGIYEKQGNSLADMYARKSNAQTDFYGNIGNALNQGVAAYNYNNALKNQAWNQSINSGGMSNPYDQNAGAGTDWSQTDW